MFLKFGKREHIESLKKGYMWFSPCIKFRKWENNDGIGDKNDGGLFFNINNLESNYNIKNVSVIVDRASYIPIFCMKRDSTYAITAQQLQTIKHDFPNYDSVLIIEDEQGFLKQIEDCFNKKAFAHNVIYQGMSEFMNDISEFINFIFDGQSEIEFVSPNKNNEVFMEISLSLINQKCKTLKINNSNYYRTVYIKGQRYRNESEYRIVLPWEQIKDSKAYYVGPIDGMIKSISELVIER